MVTLVKRGGGFLKRGGLLARDASCCCSYVPDYVPPELPPGCCTQEPWSMVWPTDWPLHLWMRIRGAINLTVRLRQGIFNANYYQTEPIGMPTDWIVGCGVSPPAGRLVVETFCTVSLNPGGGDTGWHTRLYITGDGCTPDLIALEEITTRFHGCRPIYLTGTAWIRPGACPANFTCFGRIDFTVNETPP